MKVAIPVLENNGLNSVISEHFGHAPYFAFVEIKNNNQNQDSNQYNLEIIKNPLENHGPGDIPNYLKRENVDVLIVRGIGGRAMQFFQQLGIQVYRGASGNVKTLIQAFLNKKIEDREYHVKEKYNEYKSNNGENGNCK